MVEVPDYNFLSADTVKPVTQTIGNWLDISKKTYDVRQQQANEAAGQAFLNSIDPATGQPNAALLNQNLRSNPATAMAAQQAAQHGIVLDKDTYDLHNKRLSGLMSAMGQLIADNPNGVPQDAVTAAIAKAKQNGLITDAEATQVGGSFGADPHANTATILQGMSRNLTGQQQLDAAKPPSTITDVGGAKVPIAPQSPLSSTPYTGQQTVAPGGATLGMSPEQLNKPVTIHNQNTGQEEQTTVGELLKGMGITVPSGGAPAGATSPSPNVPPSPNKPAATPSPMKTVVTAPSPDMAQKWEASTQQFNADNAAAGQYTQRVFPLAQAAHLLESGKVVTGEQAGAVNRVKSFLQTMGTTLTSEDMQTEGQAAFDKLGKYLTDYVNRQGLSQGSDQRLASAIAGSPSTHISTLANQDVVKAMVGLERMKQMAITDFNKQPNASPRQYSDFLRNWQTTHDPRAFVADMLPDDKLKKMLSGMTGQERIAYQNTIKLIRDNPGIMNMAPMP